ncbi:MAG: cytochrome c biogenesis protein CcdC [Alicyclobacillus mali]|uniref:CcdC family protein n=1 Tax=Alicyclobacillus mali (ex Roth et al. 2021) TaxID=1123961 RepID=UPI0023F5500A|nr:cytochrome c biogenesis protein CcdC [Alicyclobacillus mali (ex Roth et al. 2021)]MCL6489434.1 cytochrome c biogenesis protein CcdC [Alicyclobacillus mali (ex Roth et al. 2021)]
MNHSEVTTLIATVVAVVFAITVIFVRLRASKRPTNARKILIPPLAMSTGFLMYVFPFTREPILYAIAAFLVGCMFSYPLIATSHFYVGEDGVYLKRSRAFIYILLGLLVVRIVLHSVVERYVDVYQTGSLFFCLAFGMLVPWRIAMFVRYKRLMREMEASKSGAKTEQPAT